MYSHVYKKHLHSYRHTHTHTLLRHTYNIVYIEYNISIYCWNVTTLDHNTWDATKSAMTYILMLNNNNNNTHKPYKALKQIGAPAKREPKNQPRSGALDSGFPLN